MHLDDGSKLHLFHAQRYNISAKNGRKVCKLCELTHYYHILRTLFRKKAVSLPTKINKTRTTDMNFSTFLSETPLWILILLGLAYAAVVGYFIYIGVRLFRD